MKEGRRRGEITPTVWRGILAPLGRGRKDENKMIEWLERERKGRMRIELSGGFFFPPRIQDEENLRGGGREEGLRKDLGLGTTLSLLFFPSILSISFPFFPNHKRRGDKRKGKGGSLRNFRPSCSYTPGR